MNRTTQTLSILTRASADDLIATLERIDALRAGEPTPLDRIPELRLNAKLITDGAIILSPLPYMLGEKQAPVIVATVLKDSPAAQSDPRGLFIFPTPPPQAPLLTQYEEVVAAYHDEGRWLRWEETPLGRLIQRGTKSPTGTDTPGASSPAEDASEAATSPTPGASTTAPAESVQLRALIQSLSPSDALTESELDALTSEMAESMAQLSQSIPNDFSAEPIVRLLEEHRSALTAWQSELAPGAFDDPITLNQAMTELTSKLT